MSERFPDHKRLTITSMAHDIMLHHGENIPNPVKGADLVKAKWEGADKEQNLWFVTLTSDSLYTSSYFSVTLRGFNSSDTHRYRYNIVQNRFTHEYPLGTLVNTNEAQIAQNMYGWMTLKEAPDYIVYDEEGNELKRQNEFAKIGAQIALDEVLATAEGQALFQRLKSTWDSQQANELYQEFYALSRRSDDSFYIGAAATRAALEPLVEASRPKQLPAGQQETVDDVSEK